MLSIVFDIETDVIPTEHWTPGMKDRYKKLLAKNRRYYGDTKTDDEIKRLTACLDPMLGYVCCVSVCSLDGNKAKAPKSYYGPYKQEKATLTKFWRMAKQAPEDTLWVSFCGKYFDVPFLFTRSVRHRLDVHRDLCSARSPYSHLPHFDLQNPFGRDWRLVEVCDLLGIKSPKEDVDGSKVHELMAAGNHEAVAKYCEGDVIAQREVYKAIRWSYSIFPYRRPKSEKSSKGSGRRQPQGR